MALTFTLRSRQASQLGSLRLCLNALLYAKGLACVYAGWLELELIVECGFANPFGNEVSVSNGDEGPPLRV